MEFQLSPQYINLNMVMNNKPSFEAEEDDDDFYAQMKRQVMALISDSNEEEFPETKSVKPSYSSVTKRGLYYTTASTSANGGDMNWWQNESATTESVAVPTQLAKVWGNKSTGTGVFIPQTTAKYSRRNYKPRGGKANDGKKTYKRMERASTDPEYKFLY